MEDASSPAAAFPSMKAAAFPEQEQHLKCPRCESTNTKFCYYNNYNLSQPRHFCKSCRRYWTKGGALRNIPVGGGTRKNSKRSSSSSSSAAATDTKRSTSSTPLFPKMESLAAPLFPPPPMVDVSGSFSSLLTANGHYGGLLESFHHGGGGGGQGSLTLPDSTGESVHVPAPPPPESFWSGGGEDGNVGSAENGDNSGGWPDLSIYTPGSRFP